MKMGNHLSGALYLVGAFLLAWLLPRFYLSFDNDSFHKRFDLWPEWVSRLPVWRILGMLWYLGLIAGLLVIGSVSIFGPPAK